MCALMTFSGVLGQKCLIDKLFIVEGMTECFFTSLSTALVILQRGRKSEPERNSLLFTNSSKGFFQLQKDHRRPSTMPHMYIATRPTRLGIQQSLEENWCPLGKKILHMPTS